MINFREIFNVRYGYFMFWLVLVLFLLLFIVNRNIRTSFKIVGNIIFTSGVVSLVMVVLFNIVVNMLVGNTYKIFVSVISDTLYSNLLFRGIINMVIGGILMVIYYFVSKRENVTYS